MFKRIDRTETLSSRVTNEIEQFIIDQALPPGSRLPAERELAEQFGVSRTVVREGVRTLVATGLLEVRAGSGTVVVTPTVEAASKSMARLLATQSKGMDYYRKVSEIRGVLEVEIAGLAAARRTEEDIADMEQILSLAKEHINEPDAFVQSDVAFHSALARATYNELFALVLDPVTGILVDLRRLALAVPGTPERALRHHRAIWEDVRAGSVEKARHAMQLHLVEALTTQREALRSQETSDGSPR